MVVLAAYGPAGGSVPGAADLVGIRPNTAKRHLAESVAAAEKGEGRQDAADVVARTSEQETAARDRYHDAEAEAPLRRDGAKP